MDRKTLDAFMAWGDRANRDTGHLMDIVIAGAIDSLVGHGTVTLRPARLEEIVSRIAPRERDPDGGWVVTLLPGDSTGSVNTEQTSEEIASLAGRVLGGGNPLENEQVLLAILNGLTKQGVLFPTSARATAPDPLDVLRDALAVLQPYFDNAKQLAGSALTQRG